jgi:hypothetical protein
LKNFGLVVHKKNQGLAQKRNPKITTMIKPSQQKFKNFKNRRKFGLRKEINEASVVEEREPSKKTKKNKTNLFF